MQVKGADEIRQALEEVAERVDNPKAAEQLAQALRSNVPVVTGYLKNSLYQRGNLVGFTAPYASVVDNRRGFVKKSESQLNEKPILNYIVGRLNEQGAVLMTRKTARKALAALFEGQGFNQVYDYAPTDLRGATKILCIYSYASTFSMLSAHLNTNLFTFALDVYLKRNGQEEDLLDDYYNVIKNVVRANVSTSEWDTLSLENASEPSFAEVSGVPYRVERYLLVVKQQE